MSAARNQAIRDEVLMQLAAAFPAALPIERLLRESKRNGYDYAQDELRAAAHFLAGLDPAHARIEHAPNGRELFAATSEGVKHYEVALS